MGKEVSKTCAGFSFVLGSRIASWLPSFSVEVMHTTNILGITQASNSQLNAMVRLAPCFRWVSNQRGRPDGKARAACVTPLVLLHSGRMAGFWGAFYLFTGII